MCGIAGVFEANGSRDDLTGRLERMNDALIHRGPDEAGTLAFPEAGAGLACRRLSLLDIENGQQPMSNEDGSLHVVLNGEIYNHAELREELQGDYRFRTQCDTEVVLRLFERDGLDALPKLDGMFAIAVFDRRARRLILARDRAGMKPLYYTRTADGFLFGSEIKALIAGGYEPEPDPLMVDAYFSFVYTPGRPTCFRGVEKLRAGSYLLVEDGAARQEDYWRFRFDYKSGAQSDQDYADELLTLLKASVDSHRLADAPVGILLSGGADSTLVATLAKELTGVCPPTFSLTFKDTPELDEGKFQRAAVKSLGSEHHEIDFDCREIPALLETCSRHLDLPSLRYASMAHYKACRLASTKVKAVLTGEGADELFGGYAWFGNYVGFQLRRLTPKALLRPLAQRITEPRWGRLARVLSALDENSAIHEYGALFTVRERRDLMGDRFVQAADRLETDARLAQLDPVTEASCSTVLDKLLAQQFTQHLADGLLMVNDATSMASSVEVRIPFLSNAVIDFARKLPPDMKRRGEQEKFVLSLLWSKLPAAIAGRRKSAARTPFTHYLRGPLRGYARELLLESPGSPFDRRHLEKNFDAWLSEPGLHLRKLRALMVFQIWWNQFFGRS